MEDLDAPAQFQQLRAELDLLRGTLKLILSLEPECDAERDLLEQIRAIVIYCAQPLQSMADKMRSKETSLDHFKATASLRSIGTRLHWSMVGLDEVQELRKAFMSQMAGINVLMSVQQRASIRRLSLRSQLMGDAQSNAMAAHASNILSITSRTQIAIEDLAASLGMQTETQSKQANEMNQNLIAMEQSMHHLAIQTQRGTAVLQRIILAIEAIPLHLTLDIVRLDDVHGQSWALPLQACTTWKSFSDILQFVVYAKDRPGAKYITHNLFAVAQAKSGKEVNQGTWEAMIKPGFHLEQAVVLKVNWWAKRCLNANCPGKLVDHALEFETRKICADMAVTKLLYHKRFPSNNQFQEAKDLLERRIDSRDWYMLSRACMKIGDYERAYESLQTAISLEPRCPSFWITLGILYFNIGQNQDCLDALTKAVELNAHLWKPCMTAMMASIQTQLMLFINVLSVSHAYFMSAHD
ncbi:hypothetical protein FPCIR_9907 [Fusarium pseudocircinatum]|uniref:Ubiquitin-like domain-containing protein n=1 Tax=Fusarium pseudocircinatum TaxID=56676 RepID=A0A8H5NXB9_9HYPO|nr:hypothetical protein FPCIR_9907 [Fusarium pseudocircinatum]